MSNLLRSILDYRKSYKERNQKNYSFNSMEYLEEIKCDKEILKIEIMDTADEEEINLFLQSFYKSFGPRYSFDANWFNWFYNENPSGKCVNFLLVNQKKEIIGAYGYSLFRYFQNREVRKGVIGINGFINPEYTRKGLYSILMSRSLKYIHQKYVLAVSYLHHQNQGTVKGHLKSEWKHVKDFYFFVRQLNSSPSCPIENIIGQDKFSSLRNYPFSRTENNFFCKSYQWLHWRFKERPDKKYQVLIEEDSGNIGGYIIYTVYNADLDLRRCQVAEYDYQERKHFIRLLDKVMAAAVEKDCNTVEFLANEDNQDTEILIEQKFAKTDEYYSMVKHGSASGTSIRDTKDFKFEYGYFDVV